MNKTNAGASTNVFQIIRDVLLIAIGYSGSALYNIYYHDALVNLNSIVFFVVFTIIYVLSNKEARVYNITSFYYVDRMLRRVMKSFIMGAGCVLAIIFCFPEITVSRKLVMSFLFLAYLLLFLNTIISHKLSLLLPKIGLPRTVFVGKPGEFNKFKYFLDKTSIGIEFIGYVSMDNDSTGDYLGSVEEIEEIIKEYSIDQIYIMQKNDDLLSYVQKYVDICIDMGVTCRLVVDFYKKRKAHSYVSTVGTYPILTYHTVSLNHTERFIKRVIDILGGLVGIVVFSPIMLITAIAIKIDSKGPAVFKQIRVGQNGRQFNIYKFRSMHIDAEERKKELMKLNEIKGGVMFKMKDDPRITKVGKFIRKTSIDELPQFFNVLKGDMSLVGTRPPTIDEVEKYQYTQWRRISIKPGITGMWQANGRNLVTTFEEIVEMDIEYIDNWSLFLDMQILFKTVIVLLDRRGAY